MRIAIIGSGVSGLVAASVLHPHYEITVFESDSRLGGHANTVDVSLAGKNLRVDTGFIVFNDWTYPNFIGLLEAFDVPWVETSMSFSVRCDHCGLEYNGSDLNTLFAQRRNLLRPAFYRFLADILRFNRLGSDPSTAVTPTETVASFLGRFRFSDLFSRHYLLPMGAAIWSCPMQTFADFPIAFILEFYRNHGLLNVWNRPIWRTIVGGSHAYVDRVSAPFKDRVRLNSPVNLVRRFENRVEVSSGGDTESFDEVIFACHSDQALRMLASPTGEERTILSQFPYGDNTAVLHTDTTLLPKSRRAWASWNYHVPRETETRPSVTYNMNILQHLPTRETVCVTLNETESIDPRKVLGTYRYAHPIFTAGRHIAQSRHSELIRSRRTSFCGAYWGNGFHEDGVNSALAVCREFGIVPGWARRPPTGRMAPNPVPPVEVSEVTA